MRQKSFAYSLLMLLMLFSGTGAFAQKKEKKDSLVRLLGCNELRQMEVLGVSYRKACGNASFEHNSTKLLCDTALWNVNTNIIKAIGHVRIIQNRTVLTSDKLDYFIDDNLAQFRGSVVQLQDKDKNTLRTKDLDYNTKDSVAIFRNGGALRDKDGQIIESNFGSYDSKTATFSFIGNVNMYTDSVFVKTDNLEFNTQTNIAVFGSGTNAWRGSSMLSASAGWYNRSDEVFLFYRKVHVMTENQEAWSDSLKYYKVPNNAELFGHCELLDTTRHAAALAGYMYYNDSTSLIRMTRDPAIIMESKEGDKVDTVYVGADRLVYWTVPRCNVAESEIKDSEKRLEEIGGDPVTAYRQKAAEAARIAAEKARKQLEEEDPNAMGAMDRGSGAARRKAATQSGTVQAPPGTIQSPPAPSGIQAPSGTIQSPPAPSGTVQPAAYSRPVPSPILPAPDDGRWEPLLPGYSFAPQEPDSLKSSQEGPASMAASPDSLSAQPDSVAVADSTKIGFLQGIGNVKVFRKDMQVACDSLAYNDLDSLIRLYRNPVVWNETRRQYSADSIAVVVKDKAIEKASLMSNAFIIVQEDSLGRCFDQIKSAEMLAFFDSTGALRRFDAMGDASGIFYIEEQKALATVNKFESKMMTAILADGTIQDITYFDGIKSDAYPVVQMKPDEKVLKGFQWQPEKRPKGPQDITSLKPRKSERERYEAIPRAQFNQTDTYFPGHMKGVYKMLQQQDSLNRAKRAERQRLEELGRQQAAVADSLAGAVPSDSLAGAASVDSLAGAAGSPSGPGSVNIPGKDGAPSTLQAPDSSGTAAGGSLAAAGDSLVAGGSLAASRDSLAAAGGAEVSGAGNLPALDSSGVKVPATDTLSSPSAAANENKPVAIDQEAVARARERVAREQARREAQAEKEARRAEKEAKAAAKAAAREAEWARRDSIDAVKAAIKAEKKARKENARRMKQLEAARKRAAREQAIIEKYMAKYEKQKAKEEEKAARKAQKAALKAQKAAQKKASEAEKAARKTASESEKAASKATPGAEKAARKAASEAEKVGD